MITFENSVLTKGSGSFMAIVTKVEQLSPSVSRATIVGISSPMPYKKKCEQLSRQMRLGIEKEFRSGVASKRFKDWH